MKPCNIVCEPAAKRQMAIMSLAAAEARMVARRAEPHEGFECMSKRKRLLLQNLLIKSLEFINDNRFSSSCPGDWNGEFCEVLERRWSMLWLRRCGTASAWRIACRKWALEQPVDCSLPITSQRCKVVFMKVPATCVWSNLRELVCKSCSGPDWCR